MTLICVCLLVCTTGDLGVLERRKNNLCVFALLKVIGLAWAAKEKCVHARLLVRLSQALLFTNFTIARTIGSNLEDPQEPEIKTTRFCDCTSLFRN